jgi:hypothetical protein
MAISTADVDGKNAKLRVRVGDIEADAGTGTCVTNAVSINRMAGVITTESLTTTAGSTQTITLTCDHIVAGDMVLAVCDPLTSAGTPSVANVAVSASTAVVLLKNIHGSVALNAAVAIYFLVIKPRSSAVAV